MLGSQRFVTALQNEYADQGFIHSCVIASFGALRKAVHIYSRNPCEQKRQKESKDKRDYASYPQVNRACVGRRLGQEGLGWVLKLGPIPEPRALLLGVLLGLPVDQRQAANRSSKPTDRAGWAGTIGKGWPGFQDLLFNEVIFRMLNVRIRPRISENGQSRNVGNMRPDPRDYVLATFSDPLVVSLQVFATTRPISQVESGFFGGPCAGYRQKISSR